MQIALDPHRQGLPRIEELDNLAQLFLLAIPLT